MENDIIKKFRQQLDTAVQTAKQARFEADRKHLMGTIGQDVAKILAPVIADLAKNSKVDKKELLDTLESAVATRTVSTQIDTLPITNAIEQALASMNLPEPKVTVNIPKLSMLDMIPKIQMPETMDVKGFVQLQGVDLGNPLPVQIRDSQGNPVNLVDILSRISVGGGGGFYHVTVDDILASSGFSISSITGITNSISAALIDSTGVQYSGSNPLPVVFSSTTTTASNIVDSTGVAYSGSNPLPVVFGSSATSASNIVDSSGVAYSGSNPVPVTGTITAVTSITNSVAAAIVDSSGVEYSGSNPVPVNLVSQSLASSASALVDSTGVQYSGANPVPVNLVSQSLASSASALVDSTGVQYSGGNPVPITIISGALTSTLVVGDSGARAADNGGNPVKIGGIARTTNPAAYADGDRSNVGTDKLGRVISRPVQVRDLIQTAYATFSTGTETTLLAGVASTFLDLIYLLAANNSDAAVSIDVRSATGAGVCLTVEVPAYGTAGVALPVPIPQDVLATAWTVDLPDITGTTVSVSALFSKEI